MAGAYKSGKKVIKKYFQEYNPQILPWHWGH